MRKYLKHANSIYKCTFSRLNVSLNPEETGFSNSNSVVVLAWQSYEEAYVCAGSVFLGPWTPESVGDYASGTNHVLPTYGYARMYGGVSLDSFLKYITVQSLTEEGLRNLGPHVATMAAVEGLDAHKRAVTIRLQDIEAKEIPHLR